MPKYTIIRYYTQEMTILAPSRPAALAATQGLIEQDDNGATDPVLEKVVVSQHNGSIEQQVPIDGEYDAERDERFRGAIEALDIQIVHC